MLTDENVEKENETLPPSLCFTPVPLFRFFYLRRLSEKNANNREAGNSFLRILSPNEI